MGRDVLSHFARVLGIGLLAAVVFAAALAPVRALASALGDPASVDVGDPSAPDIDDDSSNDIDDADASAWFVDSQQGIQRVARNLIVTRHARQSASEPRQHVRPPETPPPRA